MEGKDGCGQPAMALPSLNHDLVQPRARRFTLTLLCQITSLAFEVLISLPIRTHNGYQKESK